MSYAERPLTVRCAFDRHNKKISFSSARNCSFQLLRQKIEQCFSLYGSSFSIAYKDDDGEVCEISTDYDLTEAVQYFQADADDPPVSSGSSILSGRSFGSRKITLKVHVTVDYDGRLSDTASLASLEEYSKHPGLDQDDSRSLSLGGRSMDDFDDDEMTISSGHTGSRLAGSFRSNMLPKGHPSSRGKSSSTTLKDQWLAENDPSGAYARSTPRKPESLSLTDDDDSRPPMSELGSSLDGSYDDPNAPQDRGVAWLREQEQRVIRARLGPLPESEEGSLDLERDSQMEGDLALERNPRGSYYYSYTGSLHVQDEGGSISLEQHRPTSMQLSWLAEQRVDKPLTPPQPQPADLPPQRSDNDIPREYLELMPPSAPTSAELTDCSQCGAILDFMRYICASCDENPSWHKGKSKIAPSPRLLHSYPPMASPPLGSQSSSSGGGSSTLIDGSATDGMSTLGSHFQLTDHLGALTEEESKTSYRLCPNCIGSVGVTHAVEASLESSAYSPISAHSPTGSDWYRSAPSHKGLRRHAYREQMWGHLGWEDVKHAESEVGKCSTCDAETLIKRYKCATCENFSLCRACYGHVHELHPLHPFLLVPDNVERSSSDPESLSQGSVSKEDLNQEPTLIHPGVKCAHCMLDIVGARFHCAICPSVDICSNCESAGLPGNLHSDDGGHNSSHILIKIPYPLETNEVQTASRRAVNLWTGRDAASVAFGGSSRRNSPPSSYARTVMGNPGPGSVLEDEDNDHHMLCSHCRKPVIGVRYQCANCPSTPRSYSLCTDCEVRSYEVHNPFHVFLKLPRPVTYPLETPYPAIPKLYEKPAGPPEGVEVGDGPKDYLSELVHPSAVCDRCMEPILGCWFRCGNCPLDLCDSCEENDTHDDCHTFVVLKAPVNMEIMGLFVDMENPQASPAMLPHRLYGRRVT